ncbi:MAG: gamma-glutamylcyclotransferase [Anaeromyxobacter sp.]|nr:gamma-glutamylcyclotransferase [Anaeromyxobacter sp.]MBL0275524.1 gamma-glutamylcyclotransferase [Anaeromyxobacter sp.]
MSLPVFGKAHEAQATSQGFTWFVYGSSLDRAAFAEWASSHGYAVPPFTGAVPARLAGYRLAFDVVSRHWGGAVASLAEAPGDWVEGLAVPLAGAARGLVEHKEGAVSGLYTGFQVSLTPVAGGAALPAEAFRAAEGRRLPAEAPPSAAYLDVMLRGARASGLSAEWVARLVRLSPPT